MVKYVQFNHSHLCWLCSILALYPVRDDRLRARATLKHSEACQDKEKLRRMALSDEDLHHIVSALRWVAQLPRRKSATTTDYWAVLLDLTGRMSRVTGLKIDFDRVSQIDGYMIAL